MADCADLPPWRARRDAFGAIRFLATRPVEIHGQNRKSAMNRMQSERAMRLRSMQEDRHGHVVLCSNLRDALPPARRERDRSHQSRRIQGFH